MIRLLLKFPVDLSKKISTYLPQPELLQFMLSLAAYAKFRDPEFRLHATKSFIACHQSGALLALSKEGIVEARALLSISFLQIMEAFMQKGLESSPRLLLLAKMAQVSLAEEAPMLLRDLYLGSLQKKEFKAR